MNTYGFHTIHGRAPTLATGLKVANPDLKVFIVTGDGDGLSIGGNHLLHILRRNVDVTILLFNNRIYGLTKGQYSPTSELGKVTKSSPLGTVERPINPVAFALAAAATHVSRTVATNMQHMCHVIRRAAAHVGTSFVEIYQNCNIFNDGAFDYVSDRSLKIENELQVEHGKPLVFGPIDKRRAVRIRALRPEVVAYDENTEDLWIYDETDPTHAAALSYLDYPQYPVPVGVFLERKESVYESGLLHQEEAEIQKRGRGNLQKLLAGSQTWTVK
jgi:2-oxoglutarate ferredoxin oxidoreductase subunit beta